MPEVPGGLRKTIRGVEKAMKLRILNLGAGVQSTTLALMAKTGEIESFDVAIFADTQSEPKAVYDHLQWLIREIPFPVLIRTRGDLRNNLRNGLNADGKKYVSIPAFTGAPGKNLGITRRQCTREYKIQPIEQAIRRELLGLQPGERIPATAQITQVMGLSADEPGRIAKVKARHASNRWRVEFPLADLEMTRTDCERWLESYGIPHITPRSACTFCPYRSDAEWKRMRDDDPESFADAVQVDLDIRDKAFRAANCFDDQMWLHRSCTPLGEVDFDRWKDAKGQSLFTFSAECEGMCGI